MKQKVKIVGLVMVSILLKVWKWPLHGRSEIYSLKKYPS